MSDLVLTDEMRSKMAIGPEQLEQYRLQEWTIDEVEATTGWFLANAGHQDTPDAPKFRLHLGAAFTMKGEFDPNFTAVCGRASKQNEALFEEGSKIPSSVAICRKCSKIIHQTSPWSKQASRLAKNFSF